MQHETDEFFADWELDEGDPFEDRNGPIYRRRHAQGHWQCGFRVAEKHCNGGGIAHGGMLMLFADNALFTIARDRLNSMGLTLSLHSDFTTPVGVGEVVLADGDVTHETGRMLFVRGRLYTDKATVMSFSGIIRRLRRPVTTDSE